MIHHYGKDANFVYTSQGPIGGYFRHNGVMIRFLPDWHLSPVINMDVARELLRGVLEAWERDGCRETARVSVLRKDFWGNWKVVGQMKVVTYAEGSEGGRETEGLEVLR